jgi:hypothetical protein
MPRFFSVFILIAALGLAACTNADRFGAAATISPAVPAASSAAAWAM